MCAGTTAGIFLGHSCASIVVDACVAGTCGAQLGHLSFKHRQTAIVNQPLMDENRRLKQLNQNKQETINSNAELISELRSHIRTLQNGQVIRIRQLTPVPQEAPPPYSES